MAFLLATDGRDEDVVGAFQRYREYLSSVANSFPPSAGALATSDWYFNPEDHRCPHDSWLESLSMIERSSGEQHDIRTLSLRVRLLGAYHDGYLELYYPQVFAYRLAVERGESGHRDWRYDELRLSDKGRLVHEIEWSGMIDTGVWVIEASDVEFRWMPNEIA